MTETGEQKMNNKRDKQSSGGKSLTVVGIVICLILAPILIVNLTMIIKGLINKDEVPTFGGYAPLIVLTDSMNPPTEAEFSPMFPINMTFDEEVADGLKAVTAEIFVNRTDKLRVLEVTINGKTETSKKIASGDLIIIRKAKPEEIAVGDVISFFDPDSKNGNAVVTHRVIALEYNESGKLVSFRTRGDNNNAADPISVPAEKLVGKWTGTVIPGLGSVAMFLQSTPGLIVCIAVPILLLIVLEVVLRKKSDKEKKKDTDALLKELEELRKLKEAQQKMQNAEGGMQNEGKPDGESDRG